MNNKIYCVCTQHWCPEGTSRGLHIYCIVGSLTTAIWKEDITCCFRVTEFQIFKSTPLTFIIIKNKMNKNFETKSQFSLARSINGAAPRCVRTWTASDLQRVPETGWGRLQFKLCGRDLDSVATRRRLNDPAVAVGAKTGDHIPQRDDWVTRRVQHHKCTTDYYVTKWRHKRCIQYVS